MKRVCVFCGSSPGAKPEYAEAGRLLGQMLVRKNIGLVYGGANVGVMGELARTVLDAGGEVIGVMPRKLVESEVAFKELPDLRVVDSMHERKALMAELSDGFIALPGGLGTLEEFFEVLTWSQLGLHQKPCGLLNVCQHYDKLIGFLDHLTDEKFMSSDHRDLILIDEDPKVLIEKFVSFVPSDDDKFAWISEVNEG